MHTLFRDIATPICYIDSKLNPLPLKGDKELPAGIELLIDQVVREVNPKAGKLRCVDMDTKEALTLQELVAQSVKGKNLNLDDINVLKRIDLYRRCGLSEKLIAEEFKTNTKKLQRLYPRAMSVDIASNGKPIKRPSSV